VDLHLDPGHGTPVYLQIAEAILQKIDSGALMPGDKLPTVRRMAQDTGLSPGTVRHAYDQLMRDGAIDMAQGRGTFVREGAPSAGSRQKQALAAIDQLLTRMDELGFTPREVSMYVTLAIRQRGAVKRLIPVAVVDCNPESVRQVASQLSNFSNVELSEFLLEDVRRATGAILNAYPLVVTTQTHGHEVRALLGERQEVLGKVVLSSSAGTIMELSRIGAEPGIAIYCETARFSEIIKKGLRMFPNLRALDAPVHLAGSATLQDFLIGVRVLLTAPDYLSFASPEDLEALQAFQKRGGEIVKYHHQIDNGSLMYIEDRIKAISQ
jgi:DNA-binding transcriptional regulator YhcF (GntR family)